MFLVLCQLVVHLCVVMASQKGGNITVARQFGLQGCVKLCSTYGVCLSHTFDPVQLICSLEILTVKRHDVNLTTEACATSTRYLQTIHSRKKGLRNVTQTLKVSRYKTVNKIDAARNENADKTGVIRNKKADKKDAERNEKADKAGAGRNQKADKTGVARNEKADKAGAGRKEKADKTGVARNEKAEKTGAARNGKTNEKGSARNDIADKKNVARNKKADKKDKDVTHKREPGHKLAVIGFPQTWYKARDTCKRSRRGWTLVMPKTKDEVDDMTKYIHTEPLFSAFKKPCVWFGLSNIYGDNTIFWVDGTPFVHSRFTFGRQMLRFGGKKVECGRFFLDSSLKIKDWRGAPCGSKCLFICQK